MYSFFAELRRRNVLRIAAAYVVGAWVLVQAADILLPTFDAPPATLRVLTIVLTLLFPVALALAWTFEWTPKGLVRDTGDNIDRTARVRVRRKTDYAILALAVAGVAGIVATRDWSGDLAQGSKPSAASGTEERLSIAVLPFRNVSSADSDEPLAEGIAETLIHLLGQVKGLSVTSRSSSFTFRDGKADASTIGKKLGVSSILEGSLQRSGEMLRIIASLIDTKTGTQLWTAQFDRTLDNLFEVQDEIGRSVVEALNVSLLNEEHASGLTTFRPGIEAYKAYLIGRREFERLNPEAAELAVQNFERSIELEPNYALAYAGLGDAYLLLATMDEAGMLAKAGPTIRRALELDPLLGEAYASLGQLFVLENNHDQAEAAFDRAIELNPSYAQAYLLYAQFLASLAIEKGGDPDPDLMSRSDSLLEKAYELDPLSTMIVQELSLRAKDRGELDYARKLFQAEVGIEPSATGPYVWIGNVYSNNLGRLDEAARWYHRAESTQLGNLATARLTGAYLDMLDVAAAKDTVGAAVQDQSGIPWNLQLAALWLAEAQADDTTIRQIARQLMETADGWIGFLPFKEARRALTYLLVREAQCREAREVYSGRSEILDKSGPAILQANMNPWTLVDFGYVLLECDEASQGGALLTSFLELRGHEADRAIVESPHASVDEAAALAMLRRDEEALDALERAFDSGWRQEWRRLTNHRLDPRFDSIRESARFKAIVDQFSSEALEQRQSFAANPEISDD